VDGLLLPAPNPEAAQLGPYRLIERLGFGAMGVVYRAVHEKLGRTVALKMLHRSLVADATTMARFFQEARTVNTIRHPNVVEVNDFVNAGNDIYMVMEFLVGRDLHAELERLQGTPMSPQRTVALLEQVCAALHAAHAQNIIHRDLKPANIFLCQRQGTDDFVKLLDFGFAKRDRGTGRMTRDGVVLGTVEYMAPEQARGQRIDARVDLYAVGCIAYEMLTGRRLFAGSNFADVMARHVTEVPRPLRDLNPLVPAALEQAVLRCLAKRPEDRPRSAQDLAQELCGAVRMSFDVAGHLSSHGAVRAVSEMRAGPPVVTLSPVVRSAQMTSTMIVERGIRQPRVLGAAGAALVAALLGIWGIAAARRSGPGAAAVSAPAPTAPAEPAPVLIRLDSTPRGAEIWEDGDTKIGVTPHDYLVAPGSRHRLRFSLDGHVSFERVFHVTASTTIAVTLKPEARAANKGPKGSRRAASGAAAGRRPETRTRTLDPFPR
jgi:serine/threonine-protein kinase